MKSAAALTPPPTHTHTGIMMCAITLTLLGHFGLDEDKCCGLGEKEGESLHQQVFQRKNDSYKWILDGTNLHALIISQTTSL